MSDPERGDAPGFARLEDVDDAELADIRSQVADWGIAFSKSRRFDTLTPIEQTDSQFVIETFTDLMAAYEGRGPEDWDPPSIERVCTEHIPRTVSEPPRMFESTTPVLAAFFEFLAERGHVTNADALAAAIRDLEDQIVAAAEDPENWGVAKSSLADATEAAGLSLDDIDSIETLTEVLDGPVLGPLESEPATDDPGVLDPAAGDRFDALLLGLFSYVNDRYDVLPDVSGVAELETLDPEALVPIRRRLWDGEPTDLIATYVAENPHELSRSALEQVEAWQHAVTGDFVVMEYRDEYDVFLDPAGPSAYAVRSPFSRLSELWSAAELPLAVTDIVLLPFDGQIVGDGWIERNPIKPLVWEFMGDDPEALFAEARHREGLVTTLPPEDAGETDAAADLEFYLKNADNRERYAEDIAELNTQSEELERIYHRDLGKAQARSLGHTFRDLDLRAAYVAIYDGQVIASAPTEATLRDTLESIMPDGREDFPYIYHYDP